MTSCFRVSVIMPVYNAENFLQQAVDSAVNLNEVGEVILIEDKSPDNALKVCEYLVNKYRKVKLFKHPNGENRGAGASRNLGIKMAKFDFISFLDADDWYLPNRFEAENILFRDVSVDGVYGGTGFYEEGKGVIEEKITTLEGDNLQPKNVLYKLVNMEGKFHTNSITVRKELFAKAGFFNTNLRLHQDTHMWYRFAHFGKLSPGIVSAPVAMRRVHADNRIQFKSLHSRKLFHEAVFGDFKDYNNVNAVAMKIIINRYVHVISNNFLQKALSYFKIFLSKPKLLKYYL